LAVVHKFKRPKYSYVSLRYIEEIVTKLHFTCRK